MQGSLAIYQPLVASVAAGLGSPMISQVPGPASVQTGASGAYLPQLSRLAYRACAPIPSLAPLLAPIAALTVIGSLPLLASADARALDHGRMDAARNARPEDLGGIAARHVLEPLASLGLLVAKIRGYSLADLTSDARGQSFVADGPKPALVTTPAHTARPTSTYSPIGEGDAPTRMENPVTSVVAQGLVSTPISSGVVPVTSTDSPISSPQAANAMLSESGDLSELVKSVRGLGGRVMRVEMQGRRIPKELVDGGDGWLYASADLGDGESLVPALRQHEMRRPVYLTILVVPDSIAGHRSAVIRGFGDGEFGLTLAQAGTYTSDMSKATFSSIISSARDWLKPAPAPALRTLRRKQ